MESLENIWRGGRKESFEKFYFQDIISVQLFSSDRTFFPLSSSLVSIQIHSAIPHLPPISPNGSEGRWGEMELDSWGYFGPYSSMGWSDCNDNDVHLLKYKGLGQSRGWLSPREFFVHMGAVVLQLPRVGNHMHWNRSISSFASLFFFFFWDSAAAASLQGCV